MTVKFLTMTALLLVGSWLPGTQTAARAATISVPGDYSTIADAFEVARSGDRVEVSPGYYSENRLALPSGVALVGIGLNSDAVIIDGGGRGRILLAEGVDYTTEIANITFTNGRAAGHASYERSGGAIFCSNSSLSISNCVFKNNVSDGHGGAIRCNNSTPMIFGCVFEGNEAAGGGGAIDCSFNSSPLIQGCQFRGNTASWGGALSCRGFSSPVIFAVMFDTNGAVGNKGYGGAVFADFGSTPVFRQSTYADNTARYGGAFACLSEAETNLINCTLTGNSATLLGGGLFLFNAAALVENSIIAFQEGTGISAVGGATPVITCSDIFGNTRGDWVGGIEVQLDQGDNIMADPLFCNSVESSTSPFALTEGSPCGTNDLACGYMGAWPVGCDAISTSLSTFSVQWGNQDAQLNWQARTIGGSEPRFRLTGKVEGSSDPAWEVPIRNLGGGYYSAVDANRDVTSGATYIYHLFIDEGDGEWTLVDEIRLVSDLDEIPTFAGIREFKAWPNPFNPMTTISFRLGQPQRARLSIYGLDGRRVAVLADRRFSEGEQSQSWDGKDSRGGTVSSGAYIVVIEGETERLTQKITLLK